MFLWWFCLFFFKKILNLQFRFSFLKFHFVFKLKKKKNPNQCFLTITRSSVLLVNFSEMRKQLFRKCMLKLTFGEWLREHRAQYAIISCFENETFCHWTLCFFFITHCRLLFANEWTKYNEDKEFIKSYSLGILYYYCGLQTVCAFGFLLFLSSSWVYVCVTIKGEGGSILHFCRNPSPNGLRLLGAFLRWCQERREGERDGERKSLFTHGQLLSFQ